MSSIITVENLSKAYRIGLKEATPDTLAGALAGLAKAPWRNLRRLRRLNTASLTPSNQQPATSNQQPTTNNQQPATSNQQPTTNNQQPATDILWALHDVSFEVQEGEVLGIIGRNGAGKSTLLKILSRITEPTAGRAVIHGRVSSLLEVGTGFHPELTGRENIYLNGTILGMTKREIDRKFDEIVDFSGVERFLDTPVKRYSSGMKVRLAFAVAAHLEPEILIIDEVLAVGDAEFQRRCLGKMEDVARGGRTVLFVSHNMAAVESLCRRCLLVSEGSIALDAATDATIADYLHQFRSPACSATQLNDVPREPGLTRTITKIELLGTDDTPLSVIQANAPLTIRIHYTHDKSMRLPRFGIAWETEHGDRLFFLQTRIHYGRFPDLPAKGAIDCHIPQVPLVPGRYYLTVGCAAQGRQLDLLTNVLSIDVVAADVFGTGILPLPTQGAVLVRAQWSALASPGLNGGTHVSR